MNKKIEDNVVMHSGCPQSLRKIHDNIVKANNFEVILVKKGEK